jgi:hypothetical protein
LLPQAESVGNAGDRVSRVIVCVFSARSAEKPHTEESVSAMLPLILSVSKPRPELVEGGRQKARQYNAE